MRKPRKAPPEFGTEAEERACWESHDSTDYMEWSAARPARFPNLKPTTKTISLHVPVSLRERLKVEAHKRDVTYQSLIKAWLAERLDNRPL